MQYLTENLSGVVQSLSGHDKILLLLDYDGTLTPIVERPDDAILENSVREILEKIHSSPRFILGFVSGRALDDVKRIIGVPGAYYCGNHGLEADGPGFAFRHPGLEGVEESVHGLAEILEKKLSDIDGAIVEDKGYSLVVHYRLVSEGEVEKLREGFLQEVNSIGQKLFGVKENKMTFEAVPKIRWDKGEIVKLLVDEVSGKMDSRFKTVYMGDDATDEDAFKALSELDGLTVVVGEKQSSAKYYVKSQGEAVGFLQRLLLLC